MLVRHCCGGSGLRSKCTVRGVKTIQMRAAGLSKGSRAARSVAAIAISNDFRLFRFWYHTRSGNVRRGWRRDGSDAIENAATVVRINYVTTLKRAEEALRHSEERHKVLFETMSQGVVHQDSEGKIVSMNPAAEQILGKAHEDFLGSSSVGEEHDTIREDGSPFPGLEHPSMVSLRTGLAVRDVVMGVFNPRESAYRWISIDAVPVFRTGEEQPYEVHTVFSDITERKQSETALRDAHARTTAILESIADAFYSLDDHWRFLAVNPAAERAPFGRPASELLGKVIWDVFPAIPGTRIHRHYLDAVEKRTNEHYEAQSPLNGRWYEVFMFPRPGGLDVYLRDIDDRKKAEESLRQTTEREQFLAEAIENATTAFGVGAPDGSLVFFNRAFAELTGYSREELEQRRLTWSADLTPAEWRRPEAEILKNASRSGQTARYQKEYLRKDGSRVPIELFVEPVFNGRGNLIHYRSFITDISERKRSENALRESDATLRGILNATRESIWLFSRDGIVRMANETAMRRMGKASHEIIGKHFSELVPPELVSSRRERLRQVVDSRQPVEFEDERSGITFLHCFYPVFDSEGKVNDVAVFSRDVTERKRSEEALRESGERYRHLFENLSEGFALHEMLFDDSGQPIDYRFLEVNPAFEQMTGLSRDRVVGRRLLEVMPQSERYWIEKYGEVVKKGEPMHFANRARELGREYEVIAFRPRPGQFATLFVDITERKRLERLYAVLSQVNESIVRTHDEQTLFRDVCQIVVQQGEYPLAWIGIINGRHVEPAAVYGPESAYLAEIKVEVEGEFGQGPTGTCIRENRPVINDDFETNASLAPWRQSALPRGFRASAAFPLHKENMAIGAFTLYANRPGAFDPAQVNLLEALCADISYALVALEHERKRTETEEALREADRRKNDFLALLSHELRNPLAPIKNSLYILERATPGSDQARRSLAVIDRQAGQLTRLVDDLLDVTRITRNKIKLQRGRLDLNELVRLATEDQRSLFAKAEIALEVKPNSSAVFVDADWNRLTQVVGNLLQNAAKFTGRGGSTRITVDVDAQAERTVIQVMDSGVGMAPDILTRLFQPFVQGDQTLDRSQGGLGLGLALVKGLVELHGGDVSANSAGLGKGSTFRVRLPLAMDETLGIQTGTSAIKSRRRILIIEDNVDAADTLREALQLCEHEVEVAYSGSEGLERAHEYRPEVVLCDIGLPGMNGYEVARALRASGAFNDILMVALSGYALPEDLMRAKEAGFDRHLAKPPSLEQLDELLASLPEARG